MYILLFYLSNGSLSAWRSGKMVDICAEFLVSLSTYPPAAVHVAHVQ